MSSSRFPGKVIADLAGKPMILFMLERVRRAKRVDEVAVVTSVASSDDRLVEVLEMSGAAYFRGDLDNVLARYSAAATKYSADVIVRLTGDCPLIDPAVIDAVVAAREVEAADYASNTAPPTFADGLDVECFSRSALGRAIEEAVQPAEQEHVTLWMRSPEAGLKTVNVAGVVDSSRLRLTVDYPDDLDAIRDIVDRIGDPNNKFDQFDVLRCLAADPQMCRTNRHIRNEGLLISLARSSAKQVS